MDLSSYAACKPNPSPPSVAEKVKDTDSGLHPEPLVAVSSYCESFNERILMHACAHLHVGVKGQTLLILRLSTLPSSAALWTSQLPERSPLQSAVKICDDGSA